MILNEMLGPFPILLYGYEFL